MSRTQVIVGFAEAGVNTGSVANGVYDSIFNSKDTFVLLNNLGQVVATGISFIPILRPVAIQFNTLAFTLTFERVLLDFQSGKLPSAGDVFTLVGNVAGVVATFAFLTAASPTLTVVATAVGIAANAAALLSSDNLPRLSNWVQETRNSFWGTPPYPDYHELYYRGPNLPLGTRQEMDSDENGYPCWWWSSSPKVKSPERRKCTPSPPDPDKNGTDGDSNGT